MRGSTIVVLAALAVAAVSVRACAQTARAAQPYAARADSIARLDPDAEVRKAVARHDYRFMAVCGYMCVSPGVRGKYLACGTSIIAGTTDAPPNRAAARLDSVADVYAVRYNTALAAYVRRTGTGCRS